MDFVVSDFVWPFIFWQKEIKTELSFKKKTQSYYVFKKDVSIGFNLLFEIK